MREARTSRCYLAASTCHAGAGAGSKSAAIRTLLGIVARDWHLVRPTGMMNPIKQATTSRYFSLDRQFFLCSILLLGMLYFAYLRESRYEGH